MFVQTHKGFWIIAAYISGSPSSSYVEKKLASSGELLFESDLYME